MTSTPHRLPPIGIQNFSSHIALDPTLSIYRRFATLNARNLLYLQSELASLEARLVLLDQRADDITKGNDIWAMPRSWRAMRKAGLKAELDGEGDHRSPDANGEMWNVAMEIRKVMQEYTKALQAQAWLHTLTQPTARSRRTLLHILEEKPTMISKMDAEYLAEESCEDLISLGPDRNNEALSQFLEDHLYRYFQTEADKLRSLPESSLGFFSETRIRLTIRVLAVVFSSLLPILSIVVLYFIKSNNIRLGIIVLFTVLCSTSLAFISHASNSEIIVATATYAAVQVVFVSGNISSG
ncbi:hypothetical protein L208DRAFT_1413588 [Tricholoma matsutake]|nr:hypothetical protein L208DRAFT_1413588 [Tricholoma matsutake 945]